MKCKSGWWWTELALPEWSSSFGAFERDGLALECELRSLLIFGRLDLLSLSYCTAEYLLFCILRTLHQLVYIDIYIYWIMKLAHSSTVCHPYHSDAPNTYRQLDRSANVSSPQPSENNPLMVHMMQQYSDMLLSMIHQRTGVTAPIPLQGSAEAFTQQPNRRPFTFVALIGRACHITEYRNKLKRNPLEMIASEWPHWRSMFVFHTLPT